MVRVGVVGACGRMGTAVCELVEAASDLELCCGIERQGHPDIGEPIGTGKVQAGLQDVLSGLDVLVDFSLPAGLRERAAAAAESQKAYVCGVTGLAEQDMQAMRDAAKRIPVVYASNFSVGVNVLYKLARETAEMLGPGYDIEIVETHHRHKRDAPSGTARTLAEILKQTTGVTAVVHGRSGETGPRPAKEIAVHSIRAGDVVGEHTVIFGAQGERLELTHRASSREAFASGVLPAIRFAAASKPGFYSMSDVLSAR